MRNISSPMNEKYAEIISNKIAFFERFLMVVSPPFGICKRQNKYIAQPKVSSLVFALSYKKL